jgi:hypothetical protein
MRKLTFALALVLAVALAAPAMAADVAFSGSYRVRGYLADDYDLNRGKIANPDTGHTDAYMDMRLRVRTDIKVNDNLSLTTRFDALDGKLWGATDLPAAQTGANIDWDRAYMTIKTDFGMFQVGRMSTGAFGLTVFDNEADADRIKYVLPLGNFSLVAIYTKGAEGDVGNTDSSTDFDMYALAGVYSGENFTVGMLYQFMNNDAASQLGVGRTRTDIHLFVPFFTANFGPFRIQGELDTQQGDNDIEAARDTDIDLWAFNLEGGYDFGMGAATLGYVFMSGDDNPADNDVENFGGSGNDWEWLWLLTGSTGNHPAGMGRGLGNLSNAGGVGAGHGAHIIYGGVDVNPMENLKLGLRMGWAEAEEEPTGWDEDYGFEVDFTLDWTVFDNLKYTFIAAYLWSGDYWAGLNGANVQGGDPQDCYSLFHNLTLSF